MSERGKKLVSPFEFAVSDPFPQARTSRLEFLPDREGALDRKSGIKGRYVDVMTLCTFRDPALAQAHQGAFSTVTQFEDERAYLDYPS